MEIFKALCASFFIFQYSIAKLCFALGMGEAAFIVYPLAHPWRAPWMI
jgi:hypothetical protein